MTPLVLKEKVNEHIAIITLNRPEAANALSIQLLHELIDLVEQIHYDSSVRCVILTGAGENVFCAGADLKERAGMGDEDVKKHVALIRKAIDTVEKLPQPVICAINGAAFGGGLELALACDIRIAVANAKLGLTETSLGIIPGAGGTQRLPRLIGTGKAKELIFTAAKINAKTAQQLGVVEQVVQEGAISNALILAEQISRNAPLALIHAKLAINKGIECDLETGLAIEEMAYEQIIRTNDRIEGLRAFREKRPPEYKGE
ncbi:enoyl-CoA hydratase [Bacillus sp. HMF5848]|uniref:enoyl-CoA hydratase n=1 Tax=Bacillus sp. HMF5848 TaxID=2495421 RepID=UPI000F765F8F|nr:enoyl-CoA hydratase [Bacillus sp. HMF5848]RSK26267.1 enoyl-CoA hydratase [Bacillus sp. HMF5848]